MNVERSVTQLLLECEGQESEIWHDIMPLVYDHLYHLASVQFKSERANHTLQPTALVNETYERLVSSGVSVSNQKHFFNLCCQIMRRILVDYARTNNAQKRGAEVEHVTLTQHLDTQNSNPINLIELDNLLTKLQSLQQRQSQIAELYFFGGLSQNKIAEFLDMSPSTVFRELRFLKAWLNMQLESVA